MVLLSVSYLVLARKYRPQTFAEIVGQEHVVRGLTNALTTGRIAHAFLFVGPRGIGKTSIARILAKALNCAGGPKADFDVNDPICQEIAEGRSLDVIEIDGASNNGVEQVRELRDNVQYMPTGGKFKVYIIDEVHMLTAGAFNALLKTLEEPPAHVKFIFATTEVHKLPATILSRCQRYDLRRIADLDIARHLGFIANNEGITISPEALTLLARNAEGGLRDAESALDQLITFCGREITEQDVLDMFGLTGIREIWALAEAIEAGDPEPAIRQVRALVSRGKDLLQLTRELVRYFRNQLIYHISPELAASQIDPSEVHHFAAMQPLPPKDLVLVWIEELVRLEERIRHALVKDVMFEIAIIRLTQQREKVELEHLLRTLTGGQPIPPIERPSIVPPRSKVPVAAESATPAEASDESRRASAPALVGEQEPVAPKAVMPETKPTPEPAPKADPSEKVKRASAEPTQAKGKRSISRADKEEFYQDPAIQAALERFEARAVDVREKPTPAA
ncbi:MAG: DNA polymerase III subunit gamma/tau [Candidatus Methylacidiphilales bacterium]